MHGREAEQQERRYMKSKGRIFFLATILLSIFHESAAQNLFTWESEGCLPLVENLVQINNSQFSVIRNYCPDELITMSTQLKKLQNDVEVQALELDGFQPVGSHAVDNNLRLILKSDLGYEVKDFNGNLEEVNGFDLPFNALTHFIQLVEHPGGLFAVTVMNNQAVFTLMTDTGILVEQLVMEGQSLAYPAYQTFAQLIDDTTVLISLHCDLTSYVDLTDLQNATWLDGDGNGCFWPDIMRFNTNTQTFVNLTTATGVTIVFHNSNGDVIEWFSFGDALNIGGTDVIIAENNEIYLLTLMETQQPWSTEILRDFAFYLLNDEGELLNEFILPTEDYSEYAVRMTETDDSFWIYGIRSEYESMERQAFVYRLSKDVVFTGIEETHQESSDFSLQQTPSELVVQHVNRTTFTASVYSLSGQLVGQASGKEVSLPLGNYPPGIYILVCDDGEKRRSFKVVK